MKSFITPKVTEAGKKLLQFQLEGADLESIRDTMCGHRVTAYGMPEGHTFHSAWEFQLHFDGSGTFIEFSSACTQVVDWQEVGSLNVRFVARDEKYKASVGLELPKHDISFFAVEKVEVLVYEDDDVISECGLVLSGADGGEIIIAAGISPGSVSVSAPFATGSFEPQFSISACRRESMRVES